MLKHNCSDCTHEIKVHGQNCPKCGHEWSSRVERPRRCPRCGKWLTKKEDRVNEQVPTVSL